MVKILLNSKFLDAGQGSTLKARPSKAGYLRGVVQFFFWTVA
jgi:hypothetical protein